MAEERALVLTGGQKQAVSAYVGTLFSDINFTDLNNIIERIATNKEELTDGMRDAASAFINDWDSVVIGRLETKKDRIDALLRFFDKRHHSNRDIDVLMEGENYRDQDPIVPYIIDVLLRNEQTVEFGEELSQLKEEWEELQDEQKEHPIRDEYVDPSMAYDAIIIGDKEFELANAKHNREVGRKLFAFRVKFNNFHKELMQVKQIKKLVLALKQEGKSSEKAVNIVHEKSCLAKLAINFGGTELLSILQDIHEFQKTL